MRLYRTFRNIIQSASEFPFYYLYYMTGLNKLNRLDPDADVYLMRFLSSFKGRNYIKSCYQKLAWTYLVQGNIPKYEENIKKVLESGGLFIDNDIQANMEAKSGQLPNVVLLKARLLSDGGYTDRAIHMLLDQSLRSFIKTPKELMEYNYRLGRIYQQSGDLTEALKYFRNVIHDGKINLPTLPKMLHCSRVLSLNRTRNTLMLKNFIDYV
jgi:tetratricopeptide (TPR) repeat protein